MGPDWFTVIAQIINFLILVALLKRFLCGPIVRAMDRRKAEISARLDTSASKIAEAEQERERYAGVFGSQGGDACQGKRGSRIAAEGASGKGPG